jgi:hypothetical protein
MSNVIYKFINFLLFINYQMGLLEQKPPESGEEQMRKSSLLLLLILIEGRTNVE